MSDFSFSIILIPLQQILQRIIPLIFGVNLLLHFILIISYLGVTWNRNGSEIGALRAGKAVLGLYIAFLVIDALIYIVGILLGSMPYLPITLGSLLWFFIFFGPPAFLMYLDLQSPESSGLYRSLSNPGLVLLIWLVVIIIAGGLTGATIVYY